MILGDKSWIAQVFVTKRWIFTEDFCTLLFHCENAVCSRFLCILQSMWSLSSPKKKAGFWAGVCQISTWLWILVSWPRPAITLSSSPSSSSMPLSLWEDWVLSVYHSLQRFEDQPWVPMLPILAPGLKVLWDLVPRWEPRWRFLLCTATFLYWQQYCFH